MLTIKHLAEDLSAAAGITLEEAELFLTEYFHLAAEILEAEGKVAMPALGSLLLTDTEIQFAPDATLAEEVNAPFAAFSPLPLPAEYGVEVTTPEEEADNTPTEPEEAPEEAPIAPEPEPEAEEENIEQEAEEEPVEYEYDEDEEAPKKSIWRFWWIILLPIAFTLGQLTAPRTSTKEIEVEVHDTIYIERPDTTPVAPAAPKCQFDTVRTGNYLTTMARRHYHQMEYWVYIYMANRDVLNDPDEQCAGTIVRIPSADSLGLIPGDSAKLAEARRLIHQAYN